jgi:hypothetical protein
MRFPRPLSLIVSFSLIFFYPLFLQAQSPLAHRWLEDVPRSAPPPVRTTAAGLTVPLPTATPPISVRVFPSATFIFADHSQVQTQSTTGRFQLVGLHLSEAVDIALDVPAVLLSSAATAQSLDGGAIVSFSMNPGGSGTLASLRFQAGARPGLYRVLVPGLRGPGLLQFWVADLNNPKANPPVLNPGH